MGLVFLQEEILDSSLSLSLFSHAYTDERLSDRTTRGQLSATQSERSDQKSIMLAPLCGLPASRNVKK